MGGADAGPRFAVEVLVERDDVLEVWIPREARDVAVPGTPSARRRTDAAPARAVLAIAIVR